MERSCQLSVLTEEGDTMQSSGSSSHLRRLALVRAVGRSVLRYSRGERFVASVDCYHLVKPLLHPNRPPMRTVPFYVD